MFARLATIATAIDMTSIQLSFTDAELNSQGNTKADDTNFFSVRAVGFPHRAPATSTDAWQCIFQLSQRLFADQIMR
eukprot:SAG31_NODE_16_length_36206_cov_27.355728_21_plen_77_part_00